LDSKHKPLFKDVQESSPIYVKNGKYVQKYQVCFALKENVVKIFEVEFTWAQGNSDEKGHTAFMTNYKLLIPKEKFSKDTEFSFHSNYNTYNNIKGTCLKIDDKEYDLTSTPDQWQFWKDISGFGYKRYD